MYLIINTSYKSNMDKLTHIDYTGFPELERLLSDDDYKSILEISPTEADFLFEMIKRYNPSTILEVGVAAGGSSLLLLEAIKNKKDATLYSIDCSTYYYRDTTLETGYWTKKHLNSLENWNLYTGGMVCDFIDTFQKKFDFVFLDTRHVNPGEILDFLMIFPYMKDDAVIVIHDTSVHTLAFEMQRGITNCLLMSSINGKKFVSKNHESIYFPNKQPIKNLHINTRLFSNIGAIQIDKKFKDSIFNIFNLLTLPWSYYPKIEELTKLKNFYDKHYESKYIDFYDKVITYQLGIKDIEEQIKNSKER